MDDGSAFFFVRALKKFLGWGNSSLILNLHCICFFRGKYFFRMDLNDNISEASTCDGEPRTQQYADILKVLNQRYDTLIEIAMILTRLSAQTFAQTREDNFDLDSSHV